VTLVYGVGVLFSLVPVPQVVAAVTRIVSFMAYTTIPLLAADAGVLRARGPFSADLADSCAVLRQVLSAAS